MSQQKQKKQEKIVETLKKLNIVLEEKDESQFSNPDQTQFSTALNDVAGKFCALYAENKEKGIYKLLKKQYLAPVCKCIKTTNAQKLTKAKNRTKQLVKSAGGLASTAGGKAVNLASSAGRGAFELGSKGLSGAIGLGSRGLGGAARFGGMISEKVKSLTKSQKCDVNNSKILLAVLQGKSLDEIKDLHAVTNQEIKNALEPKRDLDIGKYNQFYQSNFQIKDYGDDESGIQMKPTVKYINNPMRQGINQQKKSDFQIKNRKKTSQTGQELI